MSAQALNFENLDGGTGVALSKEELYMAVLTEYLKNEYQEGRQSTMCFCAQSSRPIKNKLS